MRQDETRPARPAWTRIAIGVVALLALTLVRGTAWAQLEDDLREGDTAFDQQNWRRAATAYDSAIRKYPTQVPPSAYGKRAAIFIIQNKLDDGLTFLHQVAEKQYPNAPEVLEQEALILWAQNKRPDAIKVAEKVVKAKPTTFSNQQLICEFYQGRDPVKTAAACEAYLASRPAEREDKDIKPRIFLGFAHLSLAQLAIRDGKSQDAKAWFAKAVDQFDTLERKFGKKSMATTNAENGLCAAYTGQHRFDRAITVCERIIQDPHKIDRNGAVWYNLARAYQANKQPKRARTAANEYVRLHKNEARGYILIGDTYYQERNWTEALDYYLRAEKLGKASTELSIKLGETYLQLPFNGSGTNPNLALAIDKLKTGMEAHPTDAELGVELGSAYLANRQDDKALITVEPLIKSKDFPTLAEQRRANLLQVSAKAYYNQSKLKDSRASFEQAYQIRPKDLTIRRGLVEVINAQALAVVEKDPKAAEALFGQALEIDGHAPMTSLNYAVFEIDRGDCDAAARYLERLKGVQRYELSYERLLARTYLCGKHPDPKRAAEHYAAAETEVRKVQANLIQAEIYTEWAPLIWDQDLDGAIDKLQTAVQFAAQVPGIGDAAKRNLAVALFKRGWRLLKDGKATDAVADFERANREPALLKGSEPLAFEFSYALALLDKGDTTTAAKMFKDLGAKGNQSAYLKAPYNKIGAQFFSAYANYRTPGLATRERAAAEFQKMSGSASGSFGAKVRELTASAYEMVAVDALRAGNGRTADKALTSAARYADGDAKRRIDLDRLVAGGKDDINQLAALGATPPEALVDLGIAYDKAGRAKDAYDTWLKARAKGVGGHDLQRWIDAKKRIYGF